MKDIYENLDVYLETEVARLFAEGIVNTIHEPLIILDSDLRVISVNYSFYKYFKVIPSETVGNLIYNLGNGQWNIPTLRELLENILPKSSIIEDFEIKHNFQDIGEKTLLLNARRLDVEEREPMILISISDLTERTRAEEALRESEEMMRLILDMSLDGICRFNYRTGLFDYLSPAVASILGYSVEELINMDVASVHAMVHPDDLPAMLASIKRLEETGEDTAEYRQKHQNGNYIWLANHMSIRKDDKGNPCYRYGSIRDITERKKAGKHTQKLLDEKNQLTEELSTKNDELIQKQDELNDLIKKLGISNQELEQFAYVASHDLREPLRMITSFLQLLELRYKDQLDGDANEFIGFAVDGAKRLDTMIIDLLEYSRLANKEMSYTDVNIENVIEKVIGNLSFLIEENSAQITYDSVPIVRADEDQMVRLIQNLIENAIKYRREETPQIYISAEKQNGNFVFSVKDNGIGIDPQYLDRIFTIFKRLHTHEEYEGTGIGLTIAQRIVHQHGGEIWAESESDKGSTFHFTIPT